MKKPDIAKRLARESGITQGRAADQLDRVVNRILSDLRKGQDAPLPGLGKFTRGPTGMLGFKREKGGSGADK
jgi:nucleoid DNA-binding protein